jgi:hypothetical protein
MIRQQNRLLDPRLSDEKPVEWILVDVAQLTDGLR